MKDAIILLTGTISPVGGVNVKLKDPQIRLRQYSSAIIYFIEKSEFKDIVFVENSGYEFDAYPFEYLAMIYGKRFEFLRRVNPQTENLSYRGKSFGEADLIDFAMKNSKLILDHDTIYKITGRCTLLNDASILRYTSSDNEFMLSKRRKWLHTYFFKIKKEDYFNLFAPLLDEMDDSTQHNIERLWYKVIQDNRVKHTSFYRTPRVHGIYGNSNGRTYDKGKLEYLILDLARILHIV